jgi:dCMP deaminase
MARISWEEHALLIAWAATLRSEDPYMKVGACALGHGNEVLGVAYNGLAPGKNVKEDFWIDRNKRRPFMIHAEANLLARIKVNQAKIVGVTLQPCSCCAQAMVAHGVEKVVYTEKYDFDKGGLDILNFYNVQLVCIPKEHIINKLKSL